MYPLPSPTPSCPARRQEPRVSSAAQQEPARTSQYPIPPPHSRIAPSLISNSPIPHKSFIFIRFNFFYSKPPPPAGMDSYPTCETLRLRLLRNFQGSWLKSKAEFGCPAGEIA